MELLTLIPSLLIALSFLSEHCASDQANLQKNLQQDAVHDHAKFTHLPFPRKLNLHKEKVKSSADEDFMPHKKLIEPSKSTKQHEKEEAAEKGAWKEEIGEEEGVINKSEYFTMDYGWVRSRRPIHNKQVP